ncbi:BBSome interacting protein 1 [Homo sapiens]|uniref:BBSome interacting protein 1 n=1 Tax=Homo sapiens TaxID=9606 RepID=A0A494C180_HUMAN|nr:BBSome interacting protein 1 [Homo sapiens]KAI4077447.1 BBSome interacting protein 1 [Homo sapiens]
MLKAAAKRPELSGKNTISNNSDMAEVKSMFREVLPKQETGCHSATQAWVQLAQP